MAIHARPINDSVLAFRTTAPTATVTLCELNLLTGAVTSDYFNRGQTLGVEENAKALLSVVDVADRERAATGIMARLISVSAIDSGLSPVHVGVYGTMAFAYVEVSGTRYFAVQFPHSITGGLNFTQGDSVSLTPGPVVNGENTFTATSPDELQAGMMVARNRGGSGVLRADASDKSRMPAVGIVVSADYANQTYLIQTSGLVGGILTATADATLFVGLNGFPTGNPEPLTFVQSIGAWVSPSLLSLSISTQLMVRTH